MPQYLKLDKVADAESEAHPAFDTKISCAAIQQENRTDSSCSMMIVEEEIGQQG
jgi:hypothetical protein